MLGLGKWTVFQPFTYQTLAYNSLIMKLRILSL